MLLIIQTVAIGLFRREETLCSIQALTNPSLQSYKILNLGLDLKRRRIRKEMKRMRKEKVG